MNLAAIVLQMTLKESIEREIQSMQQEGNYELLSSLGDVAVFEESATEVLRKNTSVPDFKQYRCVNPPPTQLTGNISHFLFKTERRMAFLIATLVPTHFCLWRTKIFKTAPGWLIFPEPSISSPMYQFIN